MTKSLDFGRCLICRGEAHVTGSGGACGPSQAKGSACACGPRKKGFSGACGPRESFRQRLWPTLEGKLKKKDHLQGHAGAGQKSVESTSARYIVAPGVAAMAAAGAAIAFPMRMSVRRAHAKTAKGNSLRTRGSIKGRVTWPTGDSTAALARGCLALLGRLRLALRGLRDRAQRGTAQRSARALAGAIQVGGTAAFKFWLYQFWLYQCK